MKTSTLILLAALCAGAGSALAGETIDCSAKGAKCPAMPTMPAVPAVPPVPPMETPPAPPAPPAPPPPPPAVAPAGSDRFCEGKADGTELHFNWGNGSAMSGRCERKLGVMHFTLRSMHIRN